jgi:NAD+ kinase
MKVGIVAQWDNPRAASLAGDVATEVRDGDVDVVVDEATGDHLLATTDDEPVATAVDEMSACDLVVSIGGDGTFLFTARGAGTTPLVGVNLGEVGFLTAVPPEAAVDTVDDLVATSLSTGRLDTRALSRVQAGGDDWTVPPALNEVGVLGPQRGHGQGIDLEVRVDGDLYTSGHADGVLVATPTGSTAYNLSEGGPLVHPAVDGLVVTVMAGRSRMPPLVTPVDGEITVRVSGAPEAVVVSDGRVGETITPPQTVRLRRAAEPVHVAGPALDFFAGLSKLD